MTIKTKIFGIGLPRTGTTSLALALKSYGIQTIHFPFGLYDHGLDAHIAEQYTAFVDTPVPMLYKQLDQRWPGSKFILTTRDRKEWLQSMKWLRTEGRKIWQPDPKREEYKQAFYGTNSFDRELLAATYDRHHRDVHRHFEGRERDILTIDITESQDTHRLVDFLGLSNDPTAWPRANASRKASFMKKVAHQFEKRGLVSAGAFVRRVEAGVRRRLSRND